MERRMSNELEKSKQRLSKAETNAKAKVETDVAALMETNPGFQHAIWEQAIKVQAENSLVSHHSYWALSGHPCNLYSSG